MSRISVKIEDSLLELLLRITGEKSKSLAISKAVEELVKRSTAKEFGKKIREGAFNYPDPQPGDESLSR